MIETWPNSLAGLLRSIARSPLPIANLLIHIVMFLIHIEKILFHIAICQLEIGGWQCGIGK